MVQKLGNTNARVRSDASDALMAMARSNSVGPAYIAIVLLKKPKFSVIACSIMAFGPISTIAYLLVSKRSHLAIIAVVGSFFWMLSNVLSAILWVAIPPLKNNWGWIIPSGVAVQELMRYLFYYVYQHSETAIVKAMNDPRTKVPLNDLSSSFSA